MARGYSINYGDELTLIKSNIYTNWEVLDYFKNLLIDHWYHTNVTEDHKLTKWGLLYTNSQDTVSDSIVSNEPKVEIDKKTNGNLLFWDNMTKW